jgi:heat shock protein HtpX
MNRLKALILLATLTALVVWAGQLVGGTTGMVLALAFAGVMNLGAWWWSDRLVLRMYGAHEISEAAAPEDAPNAFATGRSLQRAAVAVTEGLLQRLDRSEIAGVLAHELAHVRNRDTLVMTVAATLAGAVSMLANLGQWALLLGAGRSSEDGEEGSSPAFGLLGVLVAPFAAMLVQMAISRSREFLADEAGARLTRDPRALASALRKIEAWSREVSLSAGAPATAHLFIVNPFTGGGLLRLFSTHPPTEARVARLLAMEREGLAVVR